MDESNDEPDIQFVGAPEELFRVTNPMYLNSAMADFSSYLAATLIGSMRAGGRFNPPGEFGAIYCADTMSTVWSEVAARLRREGISGLPAEMGVLRIQIRSGTYVDLTKPAARATWSVNKSSLIALDLTKDESAHCHRAGRAIRAVADYLAAPSARDIGGTNCAVFADRTGSGLEWELIAATLEAAPKSLQQTSIEPW